MGLKRWNKILAALLCFSMAFSEPSTMVLASPVVEESIAEEGEILSRGMLFQKILFRKTVHQTMRLQTI